jgi:DNA-binding GntR family transcriptional regulator
MTSFPDPRKYARIADDIRAEIADGTLRPGDNVSILVTVERFGASHQTAAKGLRLLEAEGVLRRYPGVGYYVLDPPR